VSDFTGTPGEPAEVEILRRLTIEEKRRIARAAIVEFPHLDHEMLDSWLRERGVDSVVAGNSLPEKTDALLDRCETLVRSGEDPEALDRFVYGYLYPANLDALGIDPEQAAEREPLDTWDGMCESE